MSSGPNCIFLMDTRDIDGGDTGHTAHARGTDGVQQPA